MAVDATGTPTSPDGIPKYNTAVDPPSGRGFNAAMDAIQAALVAKVGAPAGIASGEVPVWNGSAWVRSSATRIAPSSLRPVRVATTVAGLGTAEDGAAGMLRLGASEFEFIGLVYDATYGKWVSPPWTVIATATGGASQGRIYSGNVAASNAGSFTVVDMKAKFDAGLRLQLRAAGVVVKTTAADQTQLYFTTNLFTGPADGSAVAGSNTGYLINDTTGGVVVVYVAGPWVLDGNVSYTDTDAHFNMRMDNATAARDWSFGGSVMARWVSA